MDCWCNVRYVGRTSKPILVRLKRHFDRQNDNDHRSRWIRKERREGRAIGISTIAICDGDGGEEERNWIKYYRDIGCDLVNSSDGGEGLLNPSDETRARMSESQRNRSPISAETRAKMSSSAKASYTPERRARVAELSRNRPPETLARIAAASRNKSPETKAKHRKKMVAWHATQTPEQKAAMYGRIVATRRATLASMSSDERDDYYRRRLETRRVNKERKRQNGNVTPVASTPSE